MAVELRWLIHDLTDSNKPPQLQWREIEDDDQGVIVVRDWTDVPAILANEL